MLPSPLSSAIRNPGLVEALRADACSSNVPSLSFTKEKRRESIHDDPFYDFGVLRKG